MSFHRSYFAYIDGLLNELENSGVGCYMGGVFAGAFAYADDITILSPSVLALKYMADICNNYATRYDVKFNAKKSSLIIFKCDSSVPPDPQIVINSEKVRIVGQIVHLGHRLKEKERERLCGVHTA